EVLAHVLLRVAAEPEVVHGHLAWTAVAPGAPPRLLGLARAIGEVVRPAAAGDPAVGEARRAVEHDTRGPSDQQRRPRAARRRRAEAAGETPLLTGPD